MPTPLEYNPSDGSEVRIAAVIDCETTGLDPDTDALLELGIGLVEYSPITGKLYRVLEEASWLQDPGRPIPLEITQLTGLTNDQVMGHMIPAALAESMIERASIVIAHNASFDRLFLENFSPVFASKPWGCSIADIDWKGEGIASSKLDYLLFKMGWYFDGHRTKEDIRATLQLLSLPLPDCEIASNFRPAFSCGKALRKNDILRARWEAIGCEGFLQFPRSSPINTIC